MALAIAKEIGDRRNEAVILYSMAGAFYEMGEPDQAIALSSASLDILVRINEPTASRVSEQLEQWRESK